MTYTQCLINATYTETWKCESFFNPGPDVFVFVCGRVRFNSDNRKRITVKHLKQRGYKLYHRMPAVGQ